MVNVPIFRVITEKKPLVFNALKLSNYSTKALLHDITNDFGDNCIKKFSFFGGISSDIWSEI